MSALEPARVVREVPAPRAGVVVRAGAIAVGRAALHLGAGRQTKDDDIDHAVGVVCLAKRGDRVEAGQPLAEVHARDEASADRAVAEVLAAYDLGEDAGAGRPIVIETLSSLEQASFD